MEKKFDQLLNEKCSWSYRSQKVVRSNKMQTKENDTSLELESTLMTIEISENKYDKRPSDTASENSQKSIEDDSSLGDSPIRVDTIQKDKLRPRRVQKNYAYKNKVTSGNSQQIMENNSWLDSSMRVDIVQKNKCWPKYNHKSPTTPKKVKSVKGKTSRLKSTAKNSKRESKVPDLGRLVQKRNVRCKDEESILSSSSDEEVLQTRYPIKNEFIEENESYSESSAIILDKEMVSDEENTLENVNTRPIIIQATAFNKNESIIRDFLEQKPETEQLTGNTQKKIMDLELYDEFPLEEQNITESQSTDSLSVVPHTLNSGKERNCNKIAKENKIEKLNIENEDPLEKIYNRKNNLEYFSENISDLDSHSDLINPYIDEFKNTSDDHIISEFLNGSFDLNAYKDVNACPEYNLNPETNNDSKEHTSPELFTDEDGFDMNVYNKRELNSVFHKNKRYKQGNMKGSKSETPDSPTIQYLSLLSDNKSQSNRQKNEVNTKSKQESPYDEFEFVPEKPTKKKTSAVRKKRNKNNKSPQLQDAFIECINIDNSTDDQMKSNKNKVNSNAKNKNRKISGFKENNEVNRRHTRNSSLTASRRIKAIGKFENSAPSNDSDICSIHEEIKSKALSRNIKKNLDKIAEDYLKNNSISCYGGKDGKLCDDKYYSKKTQKSNLVDTKCDSAKTRNSNNKKRGNMSIENTNACKLNFKKGKYSLRKGRKQKNTNEELELNLNLSHGNYNSGDCFGNQVFQNKMQTTNAKNKKSANEMSEICDSNACILRGNVNTLPAHKGTENNKHKTWDALELELLNEIDNEMPPANAKNVSKTIIVKQERLIKKNKHSKDTNLLTMTHTLSKFAKGNGFNVQYAESKYVESTVNTCKYQDQSRYKSSLLNEIVPANSQNNIILEKAMRAMEECTAEYLKPQENLMKKSLMQSSNSPFGGIENIDSSDILQFNSDIFQGNKEFFSNEVTHFTRSARKKQIERYKNSNISNTLNDLHSSVQSHSKNENFDREYLNSLPYKTKPLKNNLNNAKQINKSQELVPFTEKANNSWSDLMQKLNLENNNEQNNMNHLHDDENKGIKQTPNDDLKKFNFSHKDPNENILSNANNTMEEEICTGHEYLDPKIKKKSEVSLNKRRLMEKSNLMKKEESKISNFTDNLTFVNIKSRVRQNSTENNIQSNKRANYENKNDLAISVKRRKNGGATEKSPTYKFKAKKDGSLKLKFHSSESSTTSSSEDCKKMTIPNNVIKIQHEKKKSNKGRENYVKYIKDLSEKEFMLEKDKNNTTKSLSNKVGLVENKNIPENEIAAVSSKLMAKNDDDIFSLSSSDSEDDNADESRGSGHLCDLFDE